MAVVVGGVAYFFDDLGTGTSNDAEWLALRQALQLAQSQGLQEFDLVGDCANVIGQANGLSKCRTQSSLQHRESFQSGAASGPPRRVRWIARTQNLAGIALARRRNHP